MINLLYGGADFQMREMIMDKSFQCKVKVTYEPSRGPEWFHVFFPKGPYVEIT